MLQQSTKIYLFLLLIAGITTSGCMTTSMDKPRPVISISKHQQQSFENAIAAMERREYSRAIRILTGLSTDSPMLTGPHINLGIIYTRQGDYDSAIKSFNQALNLSPGNARVHNQLGFAYRKSGQFSQAENAYKAAINSAPGYSNAYLNLGILYDLYLYQPEKAIDYYEKYMALMNNNDNTVKKWIAEIKLRLRDKQG